jgi:tripartite-type tricarboxylate transporter receptor subunit TctC
MMRTLVAVLVAVAGVSSAIAQDKYPTKPVRWVIPYAPGGGTDVIARPIALRLGEVLGQAIVYENRAGAGGLIAGELVARAQPDGYTLLVGSGNTHIFATLLYGKISYDPVKDYATITNFVEVPNILVARTAFGAKTLQEIVSFGKANPGRINWASSGNGAGGHLALVLFAQRAGLKVTHIPYKGAGPATVAVLGGEADLLFANTGVFLAHIKAGRLRAIGAPAAKRVAVLPDLPTFAELGYPNLISGSSYGLLAPAGTPRPIVNRINKEVARILDLPDVKERLQLVGFYIEPATPEEYDKIVRRQNELLSKVAKDAGLLAK